MSMMYDRTTNLLELLRKHEKELIAEFLEDINHMKLIDKITKPDFIFYIKKWEKRLHKE